MGDIENTDEGRITDSMKTADSVPENVSGGGVHLLEATIKSCDSGVLSDALKFVCREIERAYPDSSMYDLSIAPSDARLVSQLGDDLADGGGEVTVFLDLVPSKLD